MERPNIYKFCVLLEDYCILITEVLDTAKYTDSDRWAVLYDVHAMIETLIVHNTSLNLYNWNKLNRFYSSADLPPSAWLLLMKAFIKTFIRHLEN